MKIYFNTNTPALPQNFMFALQFSAVAVGIGFTLKHPDSRKPIFSITLVFYKWSVGFGINGYLQ